MKRSPFAGATLSHPTALHYTSHCPTLHIRLEAVKSIAYHHATSLIPIVTPIVHPGAWARLAGQRTCRRLISCVEPMERRTFHTAAMVPGPLGTRACNRTLRICQCTFIHPAPHSTQYYGSAACAPCPAPVCCICVHTCTCHMRALETPCTPTFALCSLVLS